MNVVRKVFYFIGSLGLFFCLSSAQVYSQKSYKKSSTVSSFKSPLIILDAGHGGNDEGAKVRSFKEKKITLATALYAKKYLEELGYRVILTRAKDTTLSLNRRVSIANKIKGTLFVSIHFNASRNSSAQGIEIYYYDSKDHRSKESKRLASYVLHSVLHRTDAQSRGVKVGNFHVIRETSMPAVLLEGGFVTNQDESSLLKNHSYLEQIAKGVAQGVDKFLRS